MQLSGQLPGVLNLQCGLGMAGCSNNPALAVSIREQWQKEEGANRAKGFTETARDKKKQKLKVPQRLPAK